MGSWRLAVLPSSKTVQEAAVALRRLLDAIEAGELEVPTPKDIALLRRLQGTLAGWEEVLGTGSTEDDHPEWPFTNSAAYGKRPISVQSRYSLRVRKRPETQRVVGYTRVSTDEQATSGLGLTAQRALIGAECERRGWELVQVFEDAGASGKAVSGRPALAKALEAVRGGDASALVVAKLDP
jgi:hypothetical protein